MKSRSHPECVTPGLGWALRHRRHGENSEGAQLYLPVQMSNEILAKASGAVLLLIALTVTWVLSLVFATRFAHVGVSGFSAFVALQFLLWTILRQGMSIIALVIFDSCYASSRGGRRRTLSLYGIDAWMSLIITPINVFQGKFMHVLLVLIPSAFSIFATYAPSGLLGSEIGFDLHERGTQQIRISAAGGGRAHQYLMTGQEFVYNASAGCIARPNNRFSFAMSGRNVLIPSIPDMGTYVSGSNVRAARFKDVPSVLASMSAKVESNRSVAPTRNESATTVASIGDIKLVHKPIDKSSAVIEIQILMLSRRIHRQIYIEIHFRTVVADILFATFNNGSHINQVFDVRNVSQELPEKLSGKRDSAMESVLDNFIFSQNGARLLEVVHSDNALVEHLSMILAAAFAIRSASRQNWLDGAGERIAIVFDEREVVKVPARYWAAAGVVSSLLAIACAMQCLRRPTINGNLMQIVALLGQFIQRCSGAGTPNWQKAYVEDKGFEDRHMSQRVMLGYMANKNGQREIVTRADDAGVEKQAYRIGFDAPDRVTRDRLSNLYGLIAG